MSFAPPIFDATAAMPFEPLGDQEFTALMRRFGPFKANTTFALAISGGPDSMALAWCMKQWALAERHNFVAFIVDHALRVESPIEARDTEARLKKLGIAAEILRWEHPPIATKIHLVARKARYRLLTAACHRHDIKYLLTAHQRDDQGETILMRLAKGSGIDGLAGIAAQIDQDGIAVLRPFLTTAKDRLIATCKAAQLSFLTDPSNRSEKYARGRLRRVLPLLEAEGLTIERLTDLGERAADARDALDHYTRQLLGVARQRDAAGTIYLTLEHIRAAPRAIAHRAIVACLQAIHPEDYPPEQDAVTRLRALLLDDAMTPRTLHGCLISRTATHAVLMREAAAILASSPLHAASSVVWDQRWRITMGAENNHRSCAIRALGHPPHAVVDQLAPGLRRLMPQGRIRATLPAGWDGEELVFIPDFAPYSWPAPARAELINT